MSINWEYVREKVMPKVIVIGGVLLGLVILIGCISIPSLLAKKAKHNREEVSADLNSFSQSVDVTVATGRLTDYATLLTANEKHALSDQLDAYSDMLEFDIVVVTTDSLCGKSTQSFADDFYDDNEFGYGYNCDGALLLISMENHEWYVSTCGLGMDAVDRQVLEEISEETASLLSKKQYCDAIKSFISIVNNAVEEYQRDDVYDDYEESSDDYEAYVDDYEESAYESEDDYAYESEDDYAYESENEDGHMAYDEESYENDYDVFEDDAYDAYNENY